MNNQQFLLATYQASLATSLSSLPVQGTSTATATVQEVIEQPSSNATAAKSQDKVAKVSPEDEQSTVRDTGSIEDNDKEEIEENQVKGNEPVAQTSGQSERCEIVGENLNNEMPSTSRTTDGLNGQTSTQESEAQTENQKIQSKSVQSNFPKPDVLQPLDLSTTETSADNSIPRQDESEKRDTDEKSQVDCEQPLDLRLVKVVETPTKAKISVVSDEDSDIVQDIEEGEQSTSAHGEDMTPEIDTEADMTTDTRNVVVTSKASKECIPEYVPTPVSKLQKMYNKKNAGQSEKSRREENVLGEILQEEDMTLSPVKRRANQDVSTTGKKRRKTDDIIPELPVNVKDLSEKTMVTVVDIFRTVMQQNVAELRELRKVMVECNMVLSKVADGLSRHKNSLDDHEKGEQKREDRRQDFENRREEERRRDAKRWKDDERRHDDWKRELDRRERDLDRREREFDQRRREDCRQRDERSEESHKLKAKENEPALKSVVGESKSKSGGFKGRRW
ncbi:MAG: hypothetical protein AB2693_29625 [Candidatus Thiodiazotropha sp.]